MIEGIKTYIHNGLINIENYAKTDIRYLLKSSFWLSLGQVLTGLSSFLISIAFAHYVSKDIYGTYKYILSIAGVIGTFSLTGLGTVITQAVAKNMDGTLIAAFKMNLKWSIFMTIGSICAGIYYLVNDNKILGISLLLIAVMYPLLKSFELYNGYWLGKKDFQKNSLLALSKEWIAAIFVFIGIITAGNNVIILVSIFLLTNLVINAIYYCKTISHITNKQQIDYADLRFGKHISLINIFLNVSAQLDKIIIFHYLGAIQLATYIFATAMPKQIRGVLGMVGLVATPRYAERTAEELKREIPKKFFKSLVVTIPIVVVYWVTAPYIFKVFFPQYIDAIWYSQIYSLFLIVLGNTSEIAIMVKKATKEKYMLSIGTSLFNIIVMLLLINKLGILGIIISILITKVVSLVLSFVFLKKIKD